MKSENKNGCMWYDTDGNPIQAHAGMILRHKDTYYWYGQNMGGETDCSEPGHPLHPDRVGERPKVLYNEQTGKFVLWFHLDSSDYFAAHAGVAVADSPTGPFRFVREISPNGYDCRDMTLFREYTDL